MPTSPADRVAAAVPGVVAEGHRGRLLVTGLVLLGLAAAVTAILFQRHQTRRCLEFYGADHARRIAAAPVVELMVVEPGSGPATLAARTRRDISGAAGLVHLRRGLVEDANFTWDESPADGAAPTAGKAADPVDRLPLDAWDIAVEFSEPAGQGQGAGATGRRTQLVFDLRADGGGAVAVVGQPGRIGLGRIGPGLEKWIRSLPGQAGAPALR